MSDNDSISITWSIADVHEVADDLTDAQARRALAIVKDTHDCNNGITWDTLEMAASIIRDMDGGK